MSIHRHGILIVAACLLPGCAPGHIRWSEGEDLLRTALWVDQAPLANTEAPTRLIFLSNGIFDCDLPALDDPAEQELAYERLIASITREEAYHLLLVLADPGPDAPWEGQWSTAAQGTRWATAAYAHIEEVRRSGGTTLAPEYEVTSAECGMDAGAESSVEVLHHDEAALSGRFDLQEAGVRGRFQARRCQVDDDLVQVLLPWGLTRFCPPGVVP